MQSNVTIDTPQVGWCGIVHAEVGSVHKFRCGDGDQDLIRCCSGSDPCGDGHSETRQVAVGALGDLSGVQPGPCPDAGWT